MINRNSISYRLEILSRYLSYIGNIAIAGMMFLTTADVAGRYFLNSPVLGAYEITEYLMIILVFSFLAFAQSEKAHISVDIVFDYLPSRLQNILNKFNHFICLILLLLVTWSGFNSILDIKRSNEASTLLKIPDYPFAIFMVVGCLALSLQFLSDFLGVNGSGRENKS
ncbi:MAG: TRAP transporter small permease [Desulfobacteraceae bacterium]|nr:TRAP transporter small permease [Desulfobacteraceae bacterium]